MVDKVLDVLKKEIYDYLTRLPELNVTSDTVVNVTPVAKFDGSLAIPENSLGLSLVNIEEERVVKSQKSIAMASDGKVSYVNPEIKLILYVLVSANFNDYKTSLQFLSGAIRFFQSKNVFNSQNTPALHASLEKLIVDLFTLGFEQQNHLWGSLGAKYLPSVLYRVRMVTIQEMQKSGEQPPVKSVVFTESGTN